MKEEVYNRKENYLKFRKALEDFIDYRWNCLPSKLLPVFKRELIEWFERYHANNGCFYK